MLSTFNPPHYSGSCREKLDALRKEMAEEKLDLLIVNRGDEYGNEPLAAYAERLAWLTHFTGSIGTALVSEKGAELIVPPLYVEQAKAEVDASDVGVSDGVKTPFISVLGKALATGVRVGVDPWLHSVSEIEALEARCRENDAELVRLDENFVDRVWADQPGPPLAPVRPYGLEWAGRSSEDKRGEIAKVLRDAGEGAAVITALDSIAWVLNIRGGDVDIAPLAFSRLILFADGTAEFFLHLEKVSDGLEDHLGSDVRIRSVDEFEAALGALGAAAQTVRVSKAVAREPIVRALEAGGAKLSDAVDPCQLPKAIKNETEIEGARRANRIDCVAVAKFLHWLSTAALTGEVDEIGAAKQLTAFRRQIPELVDLSFPAISAAGPNAARPHYMPTPTTNRKLVEGELYMIDSGGQYSFGTTDITRTVAIGQPTEEARDCFTRVLKGHIALARIKFPEGVTGAQLDSFARRFLWEAGLDYGHGTGHGVGRFLNVHEGPQSVSAAGAVPLRPGMLVTNEPGYYKPGAYGMRHENIMLVVEEEKPDGADRTLLGLEPLALAPVDLALIKSEDLDGEERAWLNQYHERVRQALSPDLESEERLWLERSTREI